MAATDHGVLELFADTCVRCGQNDFCFGFSHVGIYIYTHTCIVSTHVATTSCRVISVVETKGTVRMCNHQFIIYAFRLRHLLLDNWMLPTKKHTYIDTYIHICIYIYICIHRYCFSHIHAHIHIY